MSLDWGIVGIIGLFAIAGGGIVVIDAFIIRKIRRLGPPPEERITGRQQD